MPDPTNTPAPDHRPHIVPSQVQDDAQRLQEAASAPAVMDAKRDSLLAIFDGTEPRGGRPLSLEDWKANYLAAVEVGNELTAQLRTLATKVAALEAERESWPASRHTRANCGNGGGRSCVWCLAPEVITALRTENEQLRTALTEAEGAP